MSEQIPADAPSPEERVDVPPPVEPQPQSAAGVSEDPHPEYMVAGAFAGAWVFAKLLRRIGGKK